MKLQAAVAGAALIATAFVLAGCSNAQSPTAVTPGGSTSMGTVVHPQDENGQGGCEDGGIRVVPCHVKLDTMNPGPVNVHLRGEGNGKETFTETDDCASAGIATITMVENNKYTVTAGATGGKCTATFSDGEEGGNDGLLHVNNVVSGS